MGLSNGLVAALGSIAGFFLLLLILPDAALTNLSNALTNLSNALTTPAAERTVTPQAPLSVGGTWTVGHVSCTLVSVQSIAGDNITQPQAGNQFVVVRVTITNQSSSEVDYDSSDFRVLNGAGNITGSELFFPDTYTANKRLNSGALVSGGTVTGDVLIQAPKGDHQAELLWQPSFISGISAPWLLGL